MDCSEGQVGGAIHGLFNRRHSNRNQKSSLVTLYPRQSFPGKTNGAHQKLVDCGAWLPAGVLKDIRRRISGIGNAETHLAGSFFQAW
jgi:hypothetical protein